MDVDVQWSIMSAMYSGCNYLTANNDQYTQFLSINYLWISMFSDQLCLPCTLVVITLLQNVMEFCARMKFEIIRKVVGWVSKKNRFLILISNISSQTLCHHWTYSYTWGFLVPLPKTGSIILLSKVLKLTCTVHSMLILCFSNNNTAN